MDIGKPTRKREVSIPATPDRVPEHEDLPEAPVEPTPKPAPDTASC